MNLFKRNESLKFVIDHTDVCAELNLNDSILNLIDNYLFEHWVIVCIGTDRSTGDALGPLVGSQLKLFGLDSFSVFGTLEEPVHALNLQETLNYINSNYPSSGVIAIDASLGQLKSVGTIQVLDGPLKPGAGVKKELPEVGHFHITGIVNVGGFMEYFVLQNTRLSLVMRMSEVIAKALNSSVVPYKAKKENALF